MKLNLWKYRSRKRDDDPAATALEIGPITIWFSYVTPICFQVEDRKKVMRRNDWGMCTGRHMRCIDPKGEIERISGEEFLERLQVVLNRLHFQKDLDKDTPPMVVADWLEDMGLGDAARVVREEET